MKTVEISTNIMPEMILRQSPDSKGIWKDYEFHINDDLEDPDFVVFSGKGFNKIQKYRVAPQNIIMINPEPDSVYQFANKFIKQFALISSPSANKIHHKNIIEGQSGLVWFDGVSIKNYKDKYSWILNKNMNYNFFKEDMDNHPRKKLISVISSNLMITEGHRKRIEFVNKLKDYFGDEIDVFGRGYNPIEDKWDAISNYKYHIVIENSSFPNYFTEKLSDTFLAETYPLYYGCTNIDSYFPENSYQIIDIYDFDKSIQIIKNAIENDYSEKYLANVREAKNLILDKYNFLELIASLCNNLNPNLPKKNVVIRPELSFKNFNKVKMVIKRSISKMIGKIRKI